VSGNGEQIRGRPAGPAPYQMRGNTDVANGS
jgi:hypothetical protein